MSEPLPASDKSHLKPQPRWLCLRVCEFVLFAGLAFASTWPLPRYLMTGLPLGTEGIATVPLLNYWTLGWNADRLAHGFRDYWDAPIFYPADDAFAYSEPQPLTGVVSAPFFWIAPYSAVAYNVVLLLALMLNGWSVSRLLLALGKDRAVALAGGAVAETLSYTHARLGILQLVPTFGIIWTIHALWRLTEKPSWQRGVVFGGAFAATFLMCGHSALFLSVILLLCGGWLVLPRWRSRRLWLGLILAGLLAAALAGPVVWKQLQVFREHQWSRPPEKVTTLSATLADFAVAPWRQWFFIPGINSDPLVWRLSPGTLKWLVCAGGVIAAFRAGRQRRFSLFALMVLLTSVILAMGPRFRIGDVVPFQWLIDCYPGFAQVRSPYRFAVFTQLMAALFIAEALQSLFNVIRRRLPWKWSACGVIALVGVALTLETWPPTQSIHVLPRWENNRAWVTWLRKSTPPDAVIAQVPFPSGSEVGDYLKTTLGMRWTLVHHRPLVNGYSGFAPQTYLDLSGLMRRFPDQASLTALRRQGVSHCVVLRSAFTREELESDPIADAWLEWELGDDRAGVDIYRLEGEPLEPLFATASESRRIKFSRDAPAERSTQTRQ